MNDSLEDGDQRTESDPAPATAGPSAFPALVGALLWGGVAYGTIESGLLSYAVLWDVTPTGALYAAGLIVGLMALNGLFQAGEAALSGLRRSRLEEMAEEGDPKADRLQRLYDDVETYCATCQVGIQISRICMVTVAVLASPRLAQTLSGRSDFAAAWLLLSILLVLFIVGMANMVFVELLFRGFARKKAEAWATRLFKFLVATRYLLWPLTNLAMLVSRALARRLGIGPVFAPPVVTEEELRGMLESSGESGELIEDEKEMMYSIMEFTDTVAREVMTPRTDIKAAEISSEPLDVARLIEETGHTRIPIYEGSIDRIIGIVHAKDLLKAMVDGGITRLSQMVRPAHFIPERKDLHQLLGEFRSGRTQMAIVQDEYGGTAGLVTIEDLVEEIVGEIVDEYDEETPEVQKLAERTWLIHGKMNLEDVNDEIGSHFESEEFDTIGGFVFGLFGRQPSANECVPHGGWELTVAETDGRRIQRVKARRRRLVQKEGA
ncbi:MAG: HlyC/CorC family transporter [Armatimonadetes bacterium]|nr:HlyC/CorC family transporter [Armatimonadota bacterium]